ncbi:MAG: bifunctional phosphoribosylaminoimidazolecarboxamide formyltransferase/IMP cyclohydrolase [Hyphomicrobiales bacterium]
MAVSAISFDIPDVVPAKRALLSVSDKKGIIELARALNGAGVELVSTGGTRKTIADAGIPVIDVSDVTNFPEIMDGRVKTLHPSVHGGLLGVRDHPDHAKAMVDHGIVGIDIVVVNLYPFEETVAAGADYSSAIENVDIGGPAMVRASAKNHAYVSIVTDPDDYDDVLNAISEKGGTSYQQRQKLAAKAFAMTAAYDAAVSNWFANELNVEMPVKRAVAGTLSSVMRYGENPHQQAGFYKTGAHRFGVSTASQLQGKQLSFNNINDTDAAFELVAEFDPKRTSAVAIIKHANPCGVAEGTSLSAAYEMALRCDPVSAFGGIVALNQTLDAQAATEIVKVFTEVIIAPDASDEAKAIVASKQNLRLLITGGLPDVREKALNVRSVAGGLLIQDRDSGMVDDLDLKVVTKRQPTEQEMADMKFAFRVAKHVKSNAIVYVKDGATVGIGAGQMSRVDSSRIAARKAQDAAEAAGLDENLAIGSVVASDAFFPFADGLLAAAEAGATAIIQPGGSMRDDDVIAAADEAGLAMVFTGMRHFRH